MLRRPLALALSLGLALCASGCFIDGTGFQQAASEGGGADGPSAGGGGGNGGTTGGTTHAGGSGAGTTGGTTSGTDTGSTTGSTSTSSTTGSTTTTTSTKECTYDAECTDPEPGNICLEPKCVDGLCAAVAANEGVHCGLPQGECWDYPTCLAGQCQQTPLGNGTELNDFDLDNCQKPVCDGNGNPIQVPDDTQAPLSNKCAEKGCLGGQVVVAPLAEGESCLTQFFKCCDGKCCDVITCDGCAF